MGFKAGTFKKPSVARFTLMETNEAPAAARTPLSLPYSDLQTDYITSIHWKRQSFSFTAGAPQMTPSLSMRTWSNEKSFVHPFAEDELLGVAYVYLMGCVLD